jgi:dihydropteroate synthase
MINDVYALRREGSLAAAAQSGLPVCLMHMQGEPRTMQAEPHYEGVVSEVQSFLRERVAACEAAGIGRDRLLLDPGFGFGKTLGHNLTLLKHLDAFHQLGQPLLVGMSRKSMIGQVLDLPVEQRLHGSVAVATMAALAGAQIIRVHDVGPTADALKMVAAVKAAL